MKDPLIVTVNKNLNPKIWDQDGNLHPVIKDKLIDIAERLVIPDNSSPQISQSGLAPEIYESWEQMGSHITQLISSQGIHKADIVVDDTAHLKLWFKTKAAGDQIVILCPSPKNTVALGQLGWKPQVDSTLAKEVASSAEVISDAIVKAINEIKHNKNQIIT
jgi:hypothetical protein